MFVYMYTSDYIYWAVQLCNIVQYTIEPVTSVTLYSVHNTCSHKTPMARAFALMPFTQLHVVGSTYSMNASVCCHGSKYIHAQIEDPGKCIFFSNVNKKQQDLDVFHLSSNSRSNCWDYFKKWIISQQFYLHPEYI